MRCPAKKTPADSIETWHPHTTRANLRACAHAVAAWRKDSALRSPPAPLSAAGHGGGAHMRRQGAAAAGDRHPARAPQPRSAAGNPRCARCAGCGAEEAAAAAAAATAVRFHKVRRPPVSLRCLLPRRAAPRRGACGCSATPLCAGFFSSVWGVQKNGAGQCIPTAWTPRPGSRPRVSHWRRRPDRVPRVRPRPHRPSLFEYMTHPLHLGFAVGILLAATGVQVHRPPARHPARALQCRL